MPEVRVPDAFEWVAYPWGPALQCRPLAALADHCFTTRVPVLTRGPLAPGDGWHQVARSMAVEPGAVLRLRQVHGTGVVLVRRHEAAPVVGADRPVGDIAVSDHPGVALSVAVADCVPILLADPKTGAVAAVHAGWRGTAAGAAMAAVEALVSRFGADPSGMVAAIGPSIGPCCYRVGADVRDVFEADGRWRGALDAWFSARPTLTALCGIPGSDPAASGGRPSMFLDTWAANAGELRLAGVPQAQIHVVRLCTSCHRDLFHSYRVDGARAGRMIGVIKSSSQ
jgi:YfiH family protein